MDHYYTYTHILKDFTYSVLPWEEHVYKEYFNQKTIKSLKPLMSSTKINLWKAFSGF